MKCLRYDDMRILFYSLFYIVMCGVTRSGINDKIPQDLGLVGDHSSPREKRSANKSRLENVFRRNSLEKNESGIKREPRHSTKHIKLGLREAPSQRSSFTKEVDDFRALEKERNVQAPPLPFYLIRNPEHMGEGARLRLDFVHPGTNISCPNFRGTAEVVAGQWRLPPDVRMVIDEGKDWGNDLKPQFTTGNDLHDATTKPKKKKGFFKGIEDFFKHSFHMDETTTPIHSTSTKLEADNTPEVTQSSILQPPFLVPHNQMSRGRENFRKNRGPSFLNARQPSKSREATFNLRIKAVAIPQHLGRRRTGS